jgi:hypothetical protein
MTTDIQPPSQRPVASYGEAAKLTQKEVRALTIFVVVVLLFVVALVIAWSFFHRPVFTIDSPGASLSSSLTRYYGYDYESMPQNKREKLMRKVDLQTIDIAESCGMPIFVDGIRIAKPDYARSAARDTGRHRIDVSMYIGDKVDMRGRITCAKGGGTKPFALRD